MTLLSTTIDTMSSSSSGRMSDNDHEIESADNNQPYNALDPFSFLNDLAQDGVLSAASIPEGQTCHTPPVSQEALFHEWADPGPLAVNDANTRGSLASPLELSMLAPDDFNSMDTKDLLNIDPMLFSDEFLSLMNPPITNPPMLGIAGPMDPSCLPYDMDTFLNSLSSMNDITYSSPSSGLTQSPEEPQAPASVTGQQASIAAPLGSLGFRDIEELNAQAARPTTIGAGAPGQSNKLPISRIPNRVSNTNSSKQRTLAMPHPPEQAETSPAPSSESANLHTKLSHSTVERRYRSNMKVHLKNLRDVVPALRCLELKTGNRVSNLSLRPGIRRVGVDADSGAEGEDVIDARGFIDGVKVAHNGSKTTAVVKAIEYVRVLKRRVLRLKREQEGLKSLVRSITGGPELLKQWETTWREQYGGPEKDEIEEESKSNKVNHCNNSEEESAEDSESDDKEDPNVSGQERSRKRAKVTKKKEKKAAVSGGGDPLQTKGHSEPKQFVPILPAQPVIEPSAGPSMPTPVQPEKRKRGRPRKTPLPPVVVSNELVQEALLAQQQRSAGKEPPKPKGVREGAAGSEHSGMSPSTRQQEARSEQYLLAAFAFFSFFNSPISFSPASSVWTGRPVQQGCSHFGAVLGPGSHMGGNFSEWTGASSASNAPSWHDAMQLAQLALSIFMLFSFMLPRLRHLIEFTSRSSKTVSSRIYSLVRSNAPPPITDPKTEEKIPANKLRITIAHRKLREERANGIIELEEEAQIYREGLEVKGGVPGLLSLLYRLVVRKKTSDIWQIERRAFSRLAEIIALKRNTSTLERLQIFCSLFQFSPRCTSSATEVANVALVLYPIWRTKSKMLWLLAVDRVRGKSALSPHIYKTYENFVLESMSIAEASSNLLRLDPHAGVRSVSSIVCDGQKAEYEAVEKRQFQSPIALLAKQAVRDYVRGYAEDFFLQVVSGKQMELADYNGFIGYNREMDRVLAAGRSLDTPSIALMDLFDQVCNVSTKHPIFDMTIDMAVVKEACCVPKGKPRIDAKGDAELKSMLYAIALYRRIFPPSKATVTGRHSSGIDTTATTPTLTSVNISSKHRVLQLCLDSSAFERSEELRKARSCVMDKLILS